MLQKKTVSLLITGDENSQNLRHSLDLIAIIVKHNSNESPDTHIFSATLFKLVFHSCFPLMRYLVEIMCFL